MAIPPKLMRLGRSAAAAAGVAALALGLATAPAHAADPVLRDLAAAKGRYMGTAVTASKLTGTYASIAGSQFNSITPGNEMKWDTTEPSQGSFNFTRGDAVVDFAQAHGMEVRGHTLVWHSQLPSWVSNGSLTADQLRAAMLNHVTTEVTHYKGKITHWDVVNEPLNEDGTFRNSVFYSKLGSSYIADAFRAARAADPAAKLYINDYNTDGTGAKSDGMYNLVKSLLAQGVPIDGVGFQAHLILGQVPSTMRANLQRFADLGVDVAVTELDIRMTLPSDATKLAQQKADYTSVMNACLGVTRCKGVTVWGFTDSDSWIPDVFSGQGAATPYDENYQPKPAYYGIAESLGWSGTTPTDPPTTSACTVTYGVNQWNTGFTASLTVRNGGSTAVNGWTLTWTYPSGQKVTQAWNATVTQSGTAVSAVNATYNATIAAGGTVSFGFNGSWSGANPAPTDFKLNGTACTAA